MFEFANVLRLKLEVGFDQVLEEVSFLFLSERLACSLKVLPRRNFTDQETYLIGLLGFVHVMHSFDSGMGGDRVDGSFLFYVSQTV